MAAGGLSYSGLTSYGKTTLPSVESWGTNMNILRDPSRSITTRRIDKVGQTSSITEMIDGSGNRACEAILQYARGVNPMVSVSYGNQGNNGGQRSGGITPGGQTQAYLPYTIIDDGAFRAPLIRQENLAPLSRLPRVWTSAFTNPDFPNFAKKIRNCGTAETTKEVKTSTLKACIRPTAVYQMHKSAEKPFEVKYVIQNPVHTSVSSGMRTQDITKQHVYKPEKETVKDLRTINMHSACSGYDQTKYIHDELALSKKMPNYSASTNMKQDIHKAQTYENKYNFRRNLPNTQAISNPGNVARGESNTSSRVYSLAPKIQPGGFHIPGQRPMQGRMVNNVGQASSQAAEKVKMSKLVSGQMHARYTL